MSKFLLYTVETLQHTGLRKHREEFFAALFMKVKSGNTFICQSVGNLMNKMR